MTDVITEIEINRPVKAVAAYVANPDNAPEWSYKFLSIEWKTDKPLKTGSEFILFTRFRRQRIAYQYKVIVYEPAEKLVLQRDVGAAMVLESYTWANSGLGVSKLTLCNTRDTGSLPVIVSRIISGMIWYANRRDLRKIKTILEKN